MSGEKLSTLLISSFITNKSLHKMYRKLTSYVEFMFRLRICERGLNFDDYSLIFVFTFKNVWKCATLRMFLSEKADFRH